MVCNLEHLSQFENLFSLSCNLVVSLFSLPSTVLQLVSPSQRTISYPNTCYPNIAVHSISFFDSNFLYTSATCCIYLVGYLVLPNSLIDQFRHSALSGPHTVFFIWNTHLLEQPLIIQLFLLSRAVCTSYQEFCSEVIFIVEFTGIMLPSYPLLDPTQLDSS